jgi:hypothetical protein
VAGRGQRAGVKDAKAPAKVVGIYRVNADGSFDALESAHVGEAEQVTMFSTYEGIVVVIGPERTASGVDG